MDTERAVEIFELAKAGEVLPEKIEDLVPLSFIGQSAVSFYRDRIKLMDRLEMTDEQRKATLKDGQDAGSLLLDIEARIGEIANQERSLAGGDPRTRNGLTVRKKIKLKYERLGLKQNQMSHAQTISNNPEIVEQVKAKAIESEDIPTKTAVLAEIRYQKEKKRRKEAEGKYKKLQIEIDADQFNYLSALDRCIVALPQKPPKDWNPEALAEATGKAKIIMNRLEVFSDQV